jgi:Glyoxalase/Bleomycin resistance protein/Dioxygenase superfamily
MAELPPPPDGLVLTHFIVSEDVERSRRFYTEVTPPDPDRVSSFLNIRVRDIHAVYAEWSARGANFLTPPKQHQYEIRCYIRDPDGHLIEVGQTTDPDGDWEPGNGPLVVVGQTVSPNSIRGEAITS